MTPELVGVAIAVKRQNVNITLWNRDNTGSDVRFRIGFSASLFPFLFFIHFHPFFAFRRERLKELLNLDEESTVRYKFFEEAVADGSTYRNATAYTYTVLNE